MSMGEESEEDTVAARGRDASSAEAAACAIRMSESVNPDPTSSTERDTPERSSSMVQSSSSLAEENRRLRKLIRSLELEVDQLRKDSENRSTKRQGSAVETDAPLSRGPQDKSVGAKLGAALGKVLPKATGRGESTAQYECLASSSESPERSPEIVHHSEHGEVDEEAPMVHRTKPLHAENVSSFDSGHRSSTPSSAIKSFCSNCRGIEMMSPKKKKEKLSDDESSDDSFVPRTVSCDSREAFVEDEYADNARSTDSATNGVDGSTPFRAVVQDRAGWLVGLLVLQSCSSFILARNEALLESHLVIVQFLTMLVGAGGNAGNQAAVRVIRGLAVGSLNVRTMKNFLWTETKMACCLSFILGISGFIRAAVFMVPVAETIAITTSLYIIVVTSIGLGAVLPLAMHRFGLDPAHSSTTIQVLMDILGVTITVAVSGAILNTSVGDAITSWFTG